MFEGAIHACVSVYLRGVELMVRLEECDAVACSMRTRSARVLAILLAPPPTQRYFTGAVTEGVAGELRYDVQSGVSQT